MKPVNAHRRPARGHREAGHLGRHLRGRGRLRAQQGREVHHLDVAALNLLDLLEYGHGLVREAGAGQLVGQPDQDRDGVLLLARLEQQVGEA